MMILRFLGFSGRGFSLKLSLKLLVLKTQNGKKFEIVPRYSILWPCCKWTTAYQWILPHSLRKKLGLNWLEVLVEHSRKCMHLLDLLKLQAPNCAKGMLKKSQMSSDVVWAMFMEGAVLLVSLFISEISLFDTRGKRAWSTAVVPLFCCTKWGFSTEEILVCCAVVFQSGGCLPPFAVVKW